MKNLLLISLLGILSCTSSHNSNELILEEPVSIEATEYEKEAIFNSPISMIKVGNKLYLFQSKGEAAALVMDTRTGEIIDSWGKRGNGPEEFMYAYSWGNTQTHFYLSDINQFKIREYICKNDSLIFENVLNLKKRITCTQGTILDNGNIVMCPVFGQEKPLLLMNQQEKILCSFGDLPDKNHASTDLRTYGGCLDAYKNKFVYAMNDLGYIACYEQKNDTIEKIWDYYLEKPVYKGEHLNKDLLKRGFVDLKMTSKYIYCVYSGKKLNWNVPGQDSTPETILIFNHKGELVRNFHTNKKIGKIAVAEEEGLIYAVGYEPDICILRYNIGKYL